MKRKVVNPYERLLEEFKTFVREVRFRHTVEMWFYKQADIDAGRTWPMEHLQQRVRAAEQIGYETILEANDTGLHVFYRKKPTIPLL